MSKNVKRAYKVRVSFGSSRMFIVYLSGFHDMSCGVIRCMYRSELERMNIAKQTN